MRLRHIPEFLIGRREAILGIAAAPRALWVGLALVLTGSVARNYDGADLVAEWHVLLHGVVVSTVNAFLIFWLATFRSGARALPGMSFRRGYVVFLALFWMTSPMAWLYAAPYERFLEPIDAVLANMWTLAAVSVWRVALITRVLSVLLGAPWRHILLVVLGFSDLAVAVGSFIAPGPLVDFMGGLRYSDVERLVSETNFNVMSLSVVLAIPALICLIVGMRGWRGSWASTPEAVARVSRGVWVVVVCASLAWVPMLMWAQPEQRKRARAEGMLRKGEIAAAFAEMSKHERGDYPPIWDPPPRKAYHDLVPNLEAVREALRRHDQAQWVRVMYLEKSWQSGMWFWLWRMGLPSEMPAAQAETIREGLRHVHGAAEVLRFHLEHDDRFGEEDREVVRGWLGPGEVAK